MINPNTGKVTYKATNLGEDETPTDVVPEEVPATFYAKLRRSMRRWLGKKKEG